MLIANTDHAATQPWPADVYLQGGERGVVVVEDPTAPRGHRVRRTAFVEVFPAGLPRTFLRGEGATVAEAERAAWRRFEAMAACSAAPGHGPFDAGGYRNGSGWCTVCGTWFAGVLPELPDDGQEPGLLARALRDPQAARELVELVDEASEDAP